MPSLTRAAVLCTRCQAFGLLTQGGVCPVCEGAGVLPRLIIPLMVVAAADLAPVPDMSFKRMVVTLSERSNDATVVVVRGITDEGMGLVASLPAARFAEILTADFIESSARWPS